MSEIKGPVGFTDPMYMIVNLAMLEEFRGFGFTSMAHLPIGPRSKSTGISAYQIDEHTDRNEHGSENSRAGVFCECFGLSALRIRGCAW